MSKNTYPNTKKLPHTRMSFAITEKMKSELEKLAVKNHIPTSELIRKYIEKGMIVDKGKEDIDFIRLQIREEIQIQLESHTNRIIGLLMKVGKMTVTMCFFTGQILFKKIFGKNGEMEFRDMFNKANHESAVYMNSPKRDEEDVFESFLDS